MLRAVEFLGAAGLVLVCSTACSAPARQRADAAEAPSSAASAHGSAAKGPLEPEREFARRKFGGVQLTDQHGRARDVFEELVRGKVVLVNFIYTECQGRCPLATETLVETRALLPGVLGAERARDVEFLSFSLDPARDTPDAFAAYADAHDIEGAWSFLTGPARELDALRHRLGFDDLDPVLDADRTQHANFVLIGDEPRGRWLHVPLNLTPEQVAEAVARVAR